MGLMNCHYYYYCYYYYYLSLFQIYNKERTWFLIPRPLCTRRYERSNRVGSCQKRRIYIRFFRFNIS